MLIVVVVVINPKMRTLPNWLFYGTFLLYLKFGVFFHSHSELVVKMLNRNEPTAARQPRHNKNI